MKRLLMAMLAGLILTIGAGAMGWWATEPVRPPQEISQAVESFREPGGLRSRLEERFGVDPSAPTRPAEELFRLIDDRRTAASSRLSVTLLAIFVVTSSLSWGALGAIGRRSGRSTPSTDPQAVDPHAVDPKIAGLLEPGRPA